MHSATIVPSPQLSIAPLSGWFGGGGVMVIGWVGLGVSVELSRHYRGKVAITLTKERERERRGYKIRKPKKKRWLTVPLFAFWPKAEEKNGSGAPSTCIHTPSPSTMYPCTPIPHHTSGDWRFPAINGVKWLCIYCTYNQGIRYNWKCRPDFWTSNEFYVHWKFSNIVTLD